MKLSGTTGLDQTIDYRGEITIPASAGKVADLGTVDMTIGGTFTSPKVGIDLESLAKKAATKAAENAISKLLGGGDKSKEKEDANDENSSNGSDKKKDAVTDLFNKAKGLFK